MDHKQAILSGKLVAGMTFSQKVWAITARIPRGKVATYAQVAAAIRCRSCRAVGTALGRNPYAPEVPCHRVVGSDGRLVGYAGGLPKKQKLLTSEGVVIANGRVDPKAFATAL